MNNKTCGDCKYFVLNGSGYCTNNDGQEDSGNDTCSFFEPKVITNGDKIRQGSNKALVIFKAQWDCNTCAYHIPKGDNDWARCKRPKDKTCIDGMLEYLNAPAESEGKDE